MKRRNFIKVAGLSLLAPGLLALPQELWDRVLILIELKGGNDGLNTIIPYTDPTYYRLRPNLAIPKNRVLQLSEQLGFHPAMESLFPIWQAGELAIVQGVGYPQPNRSHFRSIEIWESGSDSNQFLEEGWLAQLFSQNTTPGDYVADGILLDRDSTGPLTGAKVRSLALGRPEQFIRQAKRVKEVQESTDNNSLAHILKVQQDIHEAAQSLEEKLQRLSPLQVHFPPSALGRQLATAANLLRAGVKVPVIKVSHGGFDTHSNQRNQHQRLLQQLTQSMAAFRTAMIQGGMWSRVLVMTYSEFGRRVAENGSTGTDHGTAAPHFYMGGKVKGGLYGQSPSLRNLHNGDLIHHVDFRSMYETVANEWWRLSSSSLGNRKFPKIPCLKS